MGISRFVAYCWRRRQLYYSILVTVEIFRKNMADVDSKNKHLVFPESYDRHKSILWNEWSEAIQFGYRPWRHMKTRQINEQMNERVSEIFSIAQTNNVNMTDKCVLQGLHSLWNFIFDKGVILTLKLYIMMIWFVTLPISTVTDLTTLDFLVKDLLKVTQTSDRQKCHVSQRPQSTRYSYVSLFLFKQKLYI